MSTLGSMAADPLGSFAFRATDQQLRKIQAEGLTHFTKVANLRHVVKRVLTKATGAANAEVAIVPGSFNMGSVKGSVGWALRDLSVVKLTPFSKGENDGGVSGYSYFFLGAPEEKSFQTNLAWQEGDAGWSRIAIAGSDFLSRANPENIFVRRHDNVVIYHGAYRGPASVKPLPATGH
ncbi:MAG: hypothetical protein JO055_16625 [Alphaproteobacteria bacterium]|nr:hypothetical protein [Alphaproteobacteria bacterium]